MEQRTASSPASQQDSPPLHEGPKAPAPGKARRLDWVAILVSLFCSALSVAVMLRYPHPSGWDPGQWLSLSEVYLGRSHAAFTPDRYPPAFFALLAAILFVVGDPFLSLYIAVAILFFAIPYAAYWSFTLATDERRVALLFAPLVALSQPFMDILSWGGYPNLMAFPFFMLCFAFLARTTRAGAKRREFLAVGLFAALTFLSHPLATVLLGVGGVAFVLVWLVRSRDFQWLWKLVTLSTPLFAVLYLPFFAVYFFGPNVPSYVTSQPIYSIDFALFPLVPWWMRTVFPFDAGFTIVVVAAATLAALLPAVQMIRGRRFPVFSLLLRGSPNHVRETSYLLFLASFLPPLVVPVFAWSIHQYTDFARIVYFAMIPLAAVMAKVLSELCDRHLWASLRVRIERLLSRRLPRSGDRAPWPTAAVVAVAALYAFSGYTYLGLASQYYIVFDSPEHMALAEWINENTSVNDVVMLSPEPENQPNIKWIGGLTGRNTLGVYDARQLFYDRERHENLEYFEIFNNRYAITGDASEVSTQGTDAGAAFQLRISNLEFFTPRPALDFLDTRSEVVRSSGWSTDFSQFPVRNTTMVNQSGLWTISIHRSGVGLDFWQNTTMSGSVVRVTFDFSAGPVGVRELRLTPLPPAPLCGVERVADAAVWSVLNGRACRELTLTAVPALTTAQTAGNVTVVLPVNGSQGAQLTIVAAPETGFPALPLTAFDGRELLLKNAVRYLVFLRGTSGYRDFMVGAYGAEPAYENARFEVFRLPAS